jgi:NADH dehydrogenase FAD-containing subunit
MKAADKRVVILGAGFAGFETAKRLRRLLPNDWDIGICSSENHFVMTPMPVNRLTDSARDLPGVR